MARNDIKIVSNIIPEATMSYLVASGTTASISSGNPAVSVVASGTVTGVVKLAQDGAGVISATAANDARFAGLAKNDSSETAAAAGTVTVWMPLPGLIYSGLTKVSTTANTAAKLAALIGAQVVFDLTSTTWTIDAAATDAAANALVIVGGDYQTGTVYFLIKNNWTIFGSVTTLT